MSLPRVVLADDHALVMQGLKALLEGHVEVVGAAVDGRALVAAAQWLKPDIVILDISMPGLNGIEAARQLRKSLPETRLIFLTMHGDPTYVSEAFRMGASGYVLKHAVFTDLLAAIEAVMKGKRYATPSVRRPPASRDSWALTRRQREVLQLVAEGRSAKEIAVALGISVKTADFHKAGIMERLGLHTTAELTKYAVRHGMTEG